MVLMINSYNIYFEPSSNQILSDLTAFPVILIIALMSALRERIVLIIESVLEEIKYPMGFFKWRTRDAKTRIPPEFQLHAEYLANEIDAARGMVLILD